MSNGFVALRQRSNVDQSTTKRCRRTPVTSYPEGTMATLSPAESVRGLVLPFVKHSIRHGRVTFNCWSLEGRHSKKKRKKEEQGGERDRERARENGCAR